MEYNVSFTVDLLGRRTSKNDELYGYNVRNELISADDVSCNYDDIGNRTTAEQPQVFTYGPNWSESATGARWQKTEQNLLGQTVRQTRPGANGSTLETSMAYDSYGRTSQISETGQPVQSYAYDVMGEQTALTQAVGEVWRKQQSEAEYLLRDGNVWRKQTAVQSCSDADIAPLTQTAYAQLSGLSVTNTFAQLSGLSVTNTFNQVTVDIRGNETRTFGNDTQRTTQVPSCSNPQVETYAFGQLVETVDTGRNNRTVYAYDVKGNLVSSADAVGAVTAYGYNVMGQTVAVTNALGNVTVYEYDLRGNKTYEGGATYPVRYTYDVFGNQTTMTTYRNEASGVGDATTWTYDEASGALLSKTYADGKGMTYTYTDDGKLATRTNARGIVTSYAHDTWGQLLSVDYADDTPDIAYTYDAMGRQTSATDAVGTTTFTYDTFGQPTSEQVNGLYSKTLTRHWDILGRNAGYSVDGTRAATVSYDPATGRLTGMDGFAWEYVPGSHLKAKLIYPNGATATWEHETQRNLLARVTNTVNGAVVSQYDYTNDALSRRTVIGKTGAMMATDAVQSYSYNVRDELISGQGNDYAYDDIGNRIVAEGRAYTANALNQYTAIDGFTPEYDADGNQTLVQTSTGVWSVAYNAENRPVRWTQGDQEDIIIEMTYDRQGRRVQYVETRGGEPYMNAKYVYDAYLCIQRLYGITNRVYMQFVWDPTEPVATRPLVIKVPDWDVTAYYTHDGNKNVSEVIYHTLSNGIAAHYDYAPFGAITRTASATTQFRPILTENPFRFSSETHDTTLGLVYYNYRHYDSKSGRWLVKDPLKFREDKNKYLFVKNHVATYVDVLGLWMSSDHETMTGDAVRSVLPEMLDCFGDSPENRVAIEKIAKIISEANVATDFDDKYEDDMAYHYNRQLWGSIEEAINRYTETLEKEREEFSKQLKIAMENPNKREKVCTEALDIIGRLAHMWQDYYAHGINPTWFTVGPISGSPENPTAKPSSWGAWYWGGEHGGIGTCLTAGLPHGFAFEPGKRAPDCDNRIKESNEKTKILMEQLLTQWMSTCGCEYFTKQKP